MSKDASSIAANQSDGIVAHGVCRKPCIYTLLLGAVGGLLVGVVNLFAASNRWKIQDDFFDIVDAPLRSLNRFELVSFSGTSAMFHGLKSVLVLICYWVLIGLFLAWLFCLIRTGVIHEIIRDKICQYILFFAICGGICVGSLNFLAWVNEWSVLSNCFSFFDEPAMSVMLALHVRYRIEDSLPPGLRAELIFLITVSIIYWTIIGLFLAFIFCVVRIFNKRKAAATIQVLEE